MHRLSDHLPMSNAFVRYVGQVKGVLDQLGWTKSHVVGHSMGTGISCMFASCYPELVDRLVLIEGLGPMSAPAEGTASRIRKAVDAERIASEKTAKGGAKRLYPTIASAIEARINFVKTVPGSQSLSYEAAFAIVSRSIAMSPTGSTSADEGLVDMSDLNAGPVYFRYDPKLMLPTMVYLTEEQVLSMLADIKSPTLAISGGQCFVFGTRYFH
jgi:pimeloyl-ACP methyl ester carboxylesterase